MPERSRDRYLALRSRFQPESIRLAIVAESPPSSGKYFYDPVGAANEPLFAALMQQLPLAPLTKEEGLLEFQRRGWVLVDSTYEPVNKLSGPRRDEVIARDYSRLRDDLTNLMAGRSAPLVLIKKNVCRLLEAKLTKDGFTVLNDGCVVYFPSTGRQKEFQRQFSAVLSAARTLVE
jgi:hypothetical protein